MTIYSLTHQEMSEDRVFSSFLLCHSWMLCHKMAAEAPDITFSQRRKQRQAKKTSLLTAFLKVRKLQTPVLLPSLPLILAKTESCMCPFLYQSLTRECSYDWLIIIIIFNSDRLGSTHGKVEMIIFNSGSSRSPTSKISLTPTLKQGSVSKKREHGCCERRPAS